MTIARVAVLSRRTLNSFSKTLRRVSARRLRIIRESSPALMMRPPAPANSDRTTGGAGRLNQQKFTKLVKRTATAAMGTEYKLWPSAAADVAR